MRKGQIASIAACVFAVIFLISAWMLFSYYKNSQKQAQGFYELEHIADAAASVSEYASSVAVPSEMQSAELSETEKAAAEYTALHEKNPDFWGWLKIEGTSLSYPVMYTPNDPEYYLRRNFDGQDSQWGVPFLDGKCTKDGGNYLIYGHNMKDGSMFASLLSYADPKFYSEHPIISLNTANGLETYTVLAAFYSGVYDQEDYDVFRYYQYTNLTVSEIYYDYVAQAKQSALYDTGTNAQSGEQLLTLSTCSYHTKNGRFVVVARKQ